MKKTIQLSISENNAVIMVVLLALMIQALMISGLDNVATIPDTAIENEIDLSSKIANQRAAAEIMSASETIDMAGITISETAYRVAEATRQAEFKAAQQAEAARLAELAAARQNELNKSLKNISFKPGSSVLNPSSYPALNLIAEKLKNVPGRHLNVAGYTDNKGQESRNKELSQERAESVMKYLISRGIQQDRLSAEGYGSESPIADNNTKEGREANRRVELHTQ